nr:MULTISPECIES: ABC transporter permease subunit [unclassified Streptomyces]
MSTPPPPAGPPQQPVPPYPPQAAPAVPPVLPGQPNPPVAAQGQPGPSAHGHQSAPPEWQSAPAAPYAAPPPPPGGSAGHAAPWGAPVAQAGAGSGEGYRSPIPVRRTHLGQAIVAEWTKIRSVRSTVWTLVATLAVTVGIAAFVAAAVAAADEQGMPPTVPGLIGIILGHIALLTFGVLVTSTEYTTGMIRTTLTAAPRRGRLLLAKTLVFSVICFATVAAALGLAKVLTEGIVGETEASAEVTAGAWTDAILGVALYVTLLGLLALAMGALLRSSAGAITVMLGFVLLPTIAAPFMSLAESMRDLADLVAEFSAIGGLSALSTGYSASLEYDGWPQTAFLAVVTAAALAGAYARLTSSDA